jgi:hypothetical protein
MYLSPGVQGSAIKLELSAQDWARALVRAVNAHTARAPKIVTNRNLTDIAFLLRAVTPCWSIDGDTSPIHTPRWGAASEEIEVSFYHGLSESSGRSSFFHNGENRNHQACVQAPHRLFGKTSVSLLELGFRVCR